MSAIDPSMLGRKRAGDGLPADADGRAFDDAMLAHDIRAALQGVVGGIASMEKLEVESPLRDHLDSIGASAVLLDCLVGCFLDGVEIRTADTAPRGGVAVSEIAELLRRRWSGDAAAKGLRFSIDVADDVPERLGISMIGLKRVIANLIANAVGHTESGSVRVSVAGQPDGGVAWRVSDDGPGLSEETVDRVFRRGIRPVVRNGETHGLGLHVVRELSERMGARVEIGTGISGGTEAVLYFGPEVCSAHATPPDESARATRPGPARGVQTDLYGTRILLAEDNPTNQMVANQMLRALNAVVTITSDGVEAMEAFEAKEFDLVVVDIEMPRMSGLDVIRAIRGRTDGRAGVPIVALTAYALREHRDRISEAGADGLVSKPITSIDALGRALASYVIVPERRAPPSAKGPTPDGPDSSVIDLAIYDALCEAIGDEMMDELLEKVVGDLDSAGTDLAGALDPFDPEPVRSASHVLISVAGAIGATRLQTCARRLNTEAHGEGAEIVTPRVRECIGEIDHAIAFARARRGEA